MAVINLRGVPDNLAAQLKSEAALGLVGYHEYCVAILEQRGHFGLTVARMLEGAGSVVSRKKIAGSVEGAERGGTPDLSRLGKAQDGGIETLAADFADAVYGGDSVRDILPKMEKLTAALVANKKSAAEIPVPKFRVTCTNPAHMGGGEVFPCCSGVEVVSTEKIAGLRLAAQTDRVVAVGLHRAGIELDREILVRWGLAENYKPKLEEKGGAQRIGKAGKSGGVVGKDAGSHATGNDGSEGAAVGVGKPGVNMDALRDICEGKGIRPAPLSAEPVEVDLCGFKSYNEIDGENYVCGKEVHGPKVKHGEWIKI